MQIEHLKLFCQITPGFSLTNCSKNMHISQQGLSQMVNSLEKELGCKLLDRTNKGIFYTEAGLKLVECSKVFLESLHQISVSENPIQGTLFLPIPPYMISSYLKKIIGRYMRENPYVQVSFSYTNMTSESLGCLLNGKTDLAFVCNPDQDSTSAFLQLLEEHDCTFVHCKSVPACVDCHKDFFQGKILSDNRIDKETLKKYTAMINVYDEKNKQNSIPLFWQKTRYTANTIYETNKDIYMEFLYNKLGYGISMYYEDKFAQEHTLTQHIIKDGPSIDYGYIIKKNTVLSPQSQRFIDTLNLID